MKVIKEQITTTIETELLTKARIQAVIKGLRLNDILEKGLILYLKKQEESKDVEN